MYANAEQIRIGEVIVIRSEYLFEWADQNLHDYWKSKGAFTKKDMDFALSNLSQAYGRGFYVSTNPTDSQSYGTHLTIFKVQQPLIIIENFYSRFHDNKKTLSELRQICFSGNRAGNQAWLNIWNEKSLSEIVPLHQNIFELIKNSTTRSRLSALRILKPQFLMLEAGVQVKILSLYFFPAF